MNNKRKFRYIELDDENERKRIIEDVHILFMTVTQSENDAYLEYFRPLPEAEGFYQIFFKDYTYYIGRFGEYKVGYLECAMGTVEPDSAGYAALRAIDYFHPKIIVMPGIAFGMDEAKQKLGDVLVSDIVTPYEPERVSEDSYSQRSIPVPADPILKNRFKNAMGWRNHLGNGKYSDIHLGNILSGNKLVDNLDYRNELASKFKNAIGGEMEGVGLSKVCANNGVKFIVAKGICDWADGKKNKEWQPKAALAAVSLCDHVFSKRTSFDELGIFPLDKEKVKRQIELDVVNAKRGSPLWVLNRLRSDVISKLVKDLESYESSGFNDECCAAVKQDLQQLQDTSKQLGDDPLSGNSIFDYLVRFYAAYSEWNCVDGDDDEAVNDRRSKVVELKRIRKKIAQRVASHTFPLTRTLEYNVVTEMMEAQENLTTAYPDTFPSVLEALNRYRKNDPNRS